MWKPGTSGATQNLRSVWTCAATEVYAAGDGGTLLRYDGAVWMQQRVPSPYDLTGLWGAGCAGAVGGEDVWAVGKGGTLLHLYQGSWSAARSGATLDLLGIGGFAKNEFWLVGSSGAALFHTGAPAQ